MKSNISEQEVTRQFIELESIQKQIQKKKFADYVGRELNVLVEKRSRKSDKEFTGHSTCNAVVNFRASEELIGGVVKVRITEAKANCLIGVLI